MLVNHAINGSRRGVIRRSLLSPVVEGIGDLSDSEYKKLLGLADATYTDFEDVFGVPAPIKSINSSPAFRWVCHQLIRRVKLQDWNKLWVNAWEDEGWLNKYKIEYSKVRTALQSSRETLAGEKLRQLHSVFPLESNPILCNKYDQVLSLLDMLIEECSEESLEAYRDYLHEEDTFLLIVCSVAFAMYTGRVLDDLNSMNYQN